MSEIITVRNLQKFFKVYKHRQGLGGAFRNLFSREHRLVRAVDGITFSLQQGELVGYLGPNGAGKSTTIKMLTGLLAPSAGSMRMASAAGISTTSPTPFSWAFAFID